MPSSGDDSPENLMKQSPDDFLPYHQSQDSSSHETDNNYDQGNEGMYPPYSESGVLKNRNPWSTSSFLSSDGRWEFTSWMLRAPLFQNWTPVHHLYFQFSQLAILFLVLMRLNKRQRILITVYSVLQSLWGWFVLKSPDVFVWGIILAAFNILSAICSVCSDWPLRFRGENEALYRKLFRPLKISRRQFKQVLACKRNIKILHAGDHYAIEKCTRVDSLALVLNGRLLVSQNSKPLHVIANYQFVDSPEYFGVSTDELFQVTITALEDTKLIVWHRDKLRLTIMNDDFLRVIFDHVIGRDVVRKLIQVSDTVTTVNGVSHIFSKDGGEEIYINERDPMLDRKSASHQRKYIGNNNSTEIWSLTKIDEETPV